MMRKNRSGVVFCHESSWVLIIVCCVMAASTSADDPAEAVPVENALLKTIESTRLAAEVAGKIEQLNVVEGDSVTVDQTLGRIRDTAIRLQMERAKIAMAISRKKERSDLDLRLAQKRSGVASNELERAESANARISNTYQPKEIDRLRLVAESALIEIERAKHEQQVFELDVMVAENEYRQAENLLARHQIQSPAVGVVVAINKRVGEWVEPGTELLEIVRIDRLRIEGFVDGTAIDKQLVGRRADVIVLKGNEECKVHGKVVFVSPDANPINGKVRIYLEIENGAGEFLPGMRVKAFIPTSNPNVAKPSAESLAKPGQLKP